MSSSCNRSSHSKEHKTRNWLDLPRDVTSMILMKLGAFGILNSAQQVCTLWWNICKEPHMWRTIDMRNLGIRKQVDYKLKKMCRHAIDRSCGQLIEISIEYFCNDDLLNYIADSTCNLRRLRLVQCFRITDEGVSEAAEKLPLLEEIDFTVSKVSYVAVEAIARNCPLLKSLKFHPAGYGDDDLVASVIAKSVPQLQHLQLFGNVHPNNEQVLAILDGCPRLESLDIRRCRGVDLGGSLGRRCAQQIKNLKPPDAPYPFDDGYRFGAWLDYESMYEDFYMEYAFSDRRKIEEVPPDDATCPRDDDQFCAEICCETTLEDFYYESKFSNAQKVTKNKEQKKKEPPKKPTKSDDQERKKEKRKKQGKKTTKASGGFNLLDWRIGWDGSGSGDERQDEVGEVRDKFEWLDSCHGLI